MAYRSARSPQRERIWQVDIQFSRFRKGKPAWQFLRDRDQDNRRCHTAEKVPFTIHDIFRRFINGVKAFIYRLFTFDVLMRWKFRIWHERNLHSLISDGTWNYETLCCVDAWPFVLQMILWSYDKTWQTFRNHVWQKNSDRCITLYEFAFVAERWVHI